MALTGTLRLRIDRNGREVEYQYNLYGAPLNRVARKSGLREDFEYLPNGLLKCAISAGMRYCYEYDVMGRLARKSASGRTLLAMSSNKNGNRVKQTDGTGKTTEYCYDRI